MMTVMSRRLICRVLGTAQDAYDERPHDVPLVLRAAAVVGPRLRGCGREIGRLLDAVGGQRSPDERVGRLRGPDGGPADAGQCDPGPGHGVAGRLNGYRDADRREIADAALELEVAARAGAVRGGYHGLDRDLVRGQGVLERPGDEVSHRYGAAAARPARHD